MDQIINDKVITDSYAIYNGDCIPVMRSLPESSVHLSIYSPPFRGLYHYSSSDRDLSNCIDSDDFLNHYRFVVEQIYRLTRPGRITAVHCMDVPKNNSGIETLMDLPGDIVRLHKDCGFHYKGRYHIWKEPLGVRNRTMAKKLMHKTIVEDSLKASMAVADYLLIFQKRGKSLEPVTHPNGLLEYAGEREIPHDVLKYKGFTGDQIKNQYSHWIWRQYASSFWDDIRIDRVLPYRDAKEEEDEKHLHPLQLDVIERIVVLWSNPGEIVLTPFMGVGSEVYGAVVNNRKAIGIELKQSYFKQAVKNVAEAFIQRPGQLEMFA